MWTRSNGHNLNSTQLSNKRLRITLCVIFFIKYASLTVILMWQIMQQFHLLQYITNNRKTEKQIKKCKAESVQKIHNGTWSFTLCSVYFGVEMCNAIGSRVRQFQHGHHIQNVLTQVIVKRPILVVVGDQEHLRPRPGALDISRNETWQVSKQLTIRKGLRFTENYYYYRYQQGCTVLHADYHSVPVYQKHLRSKV